MTTPPAQLGQGDLKAMEREREREKEKEKEKEKERERHDNNDKSSKYQRRDKY